MEILEASKKGMLVFFSHSYSTMFGGTDFLLKPIFVRGFSGFLQLILLLGLLISWVCKKIKKCPRQGTKSTRFLYYKPTLFCSVVLALFNVFLCALNCFYWYRNGWSEEEIAILLDLGLGALAWISISVYLHTQFSNSGESKFPLLLRIWWGLFLSISCYSLVIDYFDYKNQQSLSIQLLVSDVVSALTGLFFCYVGVFGKDESEDALLREPLLGGETRVTKGATSEAASPYLNASVFSILSFNWLSPLIATGYRKTIDLEDVPDIDSSDCANESFLNFRNKLESGNGSSTVTTSKLLKTLFISTWRQIIVTAFYAIVSTLATYVGPYLIETFVQYLDGQQHFKHEGYVLVSAFFFSKIVQTLAQRQWNFTLQRAGVRTRGALITMIYNKGLTLSCQSKQKHTSGEMINFMTVDAERVGDFCSVMHNPWLMLLQIVLALHILYKSLGLASIAAFVATIVIVLLNAPLGTWQERLQNKLMEIKDIRMKATSEVLRNMRILKLQGWEMKFLSKIVELRNREERWLKIFLYAEAVMIFTYWSAPTFVSVATFGTCVLVGIPLESGKILAALATFRILQVPMSYLPETISMLAQTKVSLDRIASFLSQDDLQPDVIEKLPRGSSDTAIEIVDGDFSWDVSSPNPTLKSINFKVSQGMKVAVCGTVGSGKSSLLSCILGEVPKISGSLKLSGTKAYVAQSPWIQSGKIEDNILFGKEMDREKYEKVLEACSLKKDLEIFAFSDQTVIGERGINLSGGQKQRIQIARALYQDADIYLFDDPFSAVDAHTGTHLFKECLLGLPDSKTVIYITHQVEFLPAADLILVMKNGMITQAGKYNDILNSGSNFMELVGAHKEALSALDSAGLNSEKLTISKEGIGSGKKVVHTEDSQNGKADDAMDPKGQLVQEEEREKGRVGFQVYWKYITTAYGGALVPFMLLGQILFQLLQIVANYWMAWATPVTKDAAPQVGISTVMLVYAALAFGCSLCILARAVFLVTAGYKTATLLFKNLHLCIFRAPMSFFDATPSGRILNRASTDQSALDLAIPFSVGATAFNTINLLGIIAVMSQVAWQVFVIFIPVIAACICLQQYSLPSSRELSRLIGVSKAPVIQHFAETISGSTTIRSFDQESRFMDTNMKLIDWYSRPMFYSAGAAEWLSFRLDFLSSMTFACSLIFLVSIPQGAINPSLAGLAVTYGLNLNSMQAVVVWLINNTETKMISVERMLQYTSIPSEPPLTIEANMPDNYWPSRGEVDIRDLQIRYAPHLPLVLRGLTCTFPGGLKTGIVGRTGSGKSTLIQSLFRLVEPAAGQILIDGINISTIGLHDLRSRLSIIPQEPTMFEGTIRNNLDPLEEYTDEEIWEALDKCQLGDEVGKKECKLDSSVVENGENWSMGQRQLVCLGRVLLKKSKILVLDEATASVDTATDGLIQQTIKQHFSNSTVLTIAHRITSVIDSDMVLVLDHGLIEEYDSPTKLLEDKSSSFAKLVAEYSVRSNSKFEK
ncbi:ABC transporter C family member 3-like [Cornus florida]|uniref:ABC transporter C family member 3-like n=1 Tax=Cornus florida TaxID=4283 RepID=UPI00289CC4AC|nr:ABC transporter C family member 3-like [Cornus florida]